MWVIIAIFAEVRLVMLDTSEDVCFCRQNLLQ